MWWILLVMLAVAVFFIMVFNQLVRAKNQVHNAFSQIDVQLKRRHDLIPNLINVGKRYLAHEQNTLENVITARNHASQIQQNMANDLTGKAITELAQAENLLTKALGQFFATVEAYPELKADEIVREVMNELTYTENRIGFARQHYNDSVMSYHNQREIFPNNLISNTFHFPAMSFLEFADKSLIQQTPTVDMSC